MKKSTFMTIFSLCLTMLCPFSSTKELKVGDQAPNFSLTDQSGMVHTLNDYQGKKVALYFYPKDGSWYCTQQACSVRDSFANLEQAGITVLGVSSGSLKQKQSCAHKYKLSFPLLVATGNMLNNYGVKGLFFVTLSRWLPTKEMKLNLTLLRKSRRRCEKLRYLMTSSLMNIFRC